MNREQKNDKENLEIPEEVVFHQPGKPTVGNKHNWRQRGTMIYCSSCESEHAFYINVEDIMTGIDSNGMPIIKKKF